MINDCIEIKSCIIILKGKGSRTKMDALAGDVVGELCPFRTDVLLRRDDLDRIRTQIGPRCIREVGREQVRAPGGSERTD